MEHKPYNGHYNYETWAVNLWLDNDEGTYNYWRETTSEVFEDAEATSYSTKKKSAQLTLSERLKDSIEDDNPLASDASLFSDLMNSALSEVNWYEIAENMLEEFEEEEEEEEEIPA